MNAGVRGTEPGVLPQSHRTTTVDHFTRVRRRYIRKTTGDSPPLPLASISRRRVDADLVDALRSWSPFFWEGPGNLVSCTRLGDWGGLARGSRARRRPLESTWTLLGGRRCASTRRNAALRATAEVFARTTRTRENVTPDSLCCFFARASRRSSQVKVRKTITFEGAIGLSISSGLF